MKIEDIMKINVDNLKEEQYRAYRKHVFGILDRIKSLIDKKDWESIENMLFGSPSGDSHGMDNSCINFSYLPDVFWDIEDAITEFQRLS